MDRLQHLGNRQAKAISLYYDPVLGYKKALREGKMTVVDVCDIDGRLLTKSESDRAGNLKDDERKQPKNIRWLAKKLAYRHLMHVPNFMGSFVFINSFSFWTYHVLLITVGIPIISLPFLWVFIFQNAGLWLPLVIAFLVKFTMGCCIERRVLSDEKPYHRGIKFPVAYTVFDTVYSMLGAILGWASALTRMFTSFFATLLLLPRLDLALPGSELDGSHSTFLGLMETSRLRLEFQQVVTASEEGLFKLHSEENSEETEGEMAVAVSEQSKGSSLSRHLTEQKNNENKNGEKVVGPPARNQKGIITKGKKGSIHVDMENPLQGGVELVERSSSASSASSVGNPVGRSRRSRAEMAKSKSKKN